MTDRPTTDTIAYIRVSTEQQAGEERTSMAEQRRAVTARALGMGRVLSPGCVFEDPGASGATAEGRPGFMAMLAYCEANPRPASQPGMVFVLNDSRFGRFDDPEEATHWRFVLKRLGWQVRFCEGDDVQDVFARGVIRFIGSAQASEYRANLRRTAKSASYATAERGQWQNEAPFGYRRFATRTDGAQRVLDVGQRKSDDEVVRLTLGPETEQAIVRWIFETYGAGGISLGALGRALDERYPYRAWPKQSVRALLQNPTYVGDVVWGRRPHGETSGQRRENDASKWTVVRDAHPAIIARDLYELVQRRLASNQRERRATAGGYPLSGLIRCSACGMPFSGGGGRRGPAGDPDRYRFYRDTGGVGRPVKCAPPMLTLRKRWVEKEVISAIGTLVAHPATQERIAEEVRALVFQTRDATRTRRAPLDAEREKMILQRKRLVDAVAAGVVSENEAASSLSEVRARISAIDMEVERLRFSERATATVDTDVERLIRLAQDFPTQAKRLSGAALRELLKPWIADAVVNKEKRVLTLTLWRVPGADRYMQLDGSPPRDALKNTYRRLTVRRSLRIPPRPGKRWHDDVAAAGGAR